MTASRIYKVNVANTNLKGAVTRYIRANSKAQAERFAMQKYISSRVASQDDIIAACESGDGIEDARKEAAVDE